MPRIQITLVNKTVLSPKVYLLTFKTDSEIIYTPGQFLSIEIHPGQNRPYSISYLGKKVPVFENPAQIHSDLETGNYISLMISTKPGGPASEYFDKIQNGDSLNAVGPSGRFGLLESDRPKVFVATGTGLAPFVAMIHTLLDKNPQTKIDLFFGCWDISGNFVNQFFGDIKSKAENLQIYTVAEDLQGTAETDILKLGRVTTAIPVLIKNLDEKDFYLCGHPAMVSAMNQVLLESGAKMENIVMEKFGPAPSASLKS